ncbi:MAG: glutaredoxin family protein [Elusimicrobia bacterium]|nr:glutaredoxin family protein [Elusimicrobiota bacterium]
MNIQTVEGKQKADIMLYALSTCGWCKKTKEYLRELGVAYRYVFVDTLSEPDKSEAVAAITAWNPDCSFPTIVIDNNRCIVGFNAEELKKIAGK